MKIICEKCGALDMPAPDSNESRTIAVFNRKVLSSLRCHKCGSKLKAEEGTPYTTPDLEMFNELVKSAPDEVKIKVLNHQYVEITQNVVKEQWGRWMSNPISGACLWYGHICKDGGVMWDCNLIVTSPCREKATESMFEYVRKGMLNYLKGAEMAYKQLDASEFENDDVYQQIQKELDHEKHLRLEITKKVPEMQNKIDMLNNEIREKNVKIEKLQMEIYKLKEEM